MNSERGRVHVHDVAVAVDIDSMPAGPELNALMAERVMGWKPWQSPCAPLPGEPDCWVTDEDERPTVVASWWSPSTDIAAAMEVAANLRKRGLWLTLCVDAYGWNAGFVPRSMQPKWTDWSHMGAPTAPLAVCRAAYKALEAK